MVAKLQEAKTMSFVLKITVGHFPIEETVSGILFQENCFGEENSLSLTEFYGNTEFCGKLGEFALTHK